MKVKITISKGLLKKVFHVANDKLVAMQINDETFAAIQEVNKLFEEYDTDVEVNNAQLDI